MDHNVSRAITNGLRARGIDVLTAYEDGASELEDSALLDRATELRRILFTQDDDFLAETANRQQSEESFSGVIYAHQLRVSVGDCIRDLELMAEVLESHELAGKAMFLPL